MPSISYAITACNEHVELERLLDQLNEHIRPEDEILVQLDTTSTAEVKAVAEKYNVGTKYDYHRIFFGLNNDFASFKNNLKEVEVIFKSEAVLAVSPKISSENKAILNKLQFRIQSVLRARKSKYILMNVPNDKIELISSILPVLKSPTVMPLAQAGWSSVHTVIEEDRFWEVIDELKAAGAEGILVCPIEKMVL